MMDILAVIPARSGSKGVPGKNIQSVAGKPLMAYSIGHALDAELVTRTIVSTDSEAYATIARVHGAETPFLRPPEISDDMATDFDLFVHALNWLEANESYVPDIVVHLRPTCPIRVDGVVDRAIQMLIDHPNADSVRSVARAETHPMHIWFATNERFITPALKAYSGPRQRLNPAFAQNGCVDVFRPRALFEKGSMTGDVVAGLFMDDHIDIDTPEQMADIEAELIRMKG